jgi:hypothetical protein
MASGFKKATVKSSRVPSTQSNFPVYIDLKRLNGGTSMTSAEANSIRVYANESKTTEWAREIVSVDEMHVKVPSMTSTTDIYVDWDGSRSDYGVTDTYGRNAVWSGYKAVYHHKTLTLDSTGNYDTTNTNSVGSGTGKIGDGADFGTSNTNKRLAIDSTLGLGNTEAYTMSSWVKMRTEISTGTQCFVTKCLTGTPWSQGRIEYQFNGGTRRILFGVNSSGGFRIVTENLAMGTSNFYLITGTYSGGTSGTLTLYRDGVSKGTNTASLSLSSSSNNLTIGALENTIFPGSIITDEVRIKSGEDSADWITTEYNNQNDEADFWGTWTDAGGSPAVAKGGILLAW